jgi:hypothetical protein
MIHNVSGNAQQWLVFGLGAVVSVVLFLIARYAPGPTNSGSRRSFTRQKGIGVSGWLCVTGLFFVLICLVLDRRSGFAWPFGWTLFIGGGLVWVARIPARRAPATGETRDPDHHESS